MAGNGLQLGWSQAETYRRLDTSTNFTKQINKMLWSIPKSSNSNRTWHVGWQPCPCHCSGSVSEDVHIQAVRARTGSVGLIVPFRCRLCTASCEQLYKTAAPITCDHTLTGFFFQPHCLAFSGAGCTQAAGCLAQLDSNMEEEIYHHDLCIVL